MMSVWRLSVAYISPKSRTERPRKTKIGRGSPRHTWLGHHFQGQKVEGQGYQVALLTAALTRQAAAAVSVGTYWPWEPTATLQSCVVGSTGAYCGGRPPAYSLLATALFQFYVRHEPFSSDYSQPGSGGRWWRLETSQRQNHHST